MAARRGAEARRHREKKEEKPSPGALNRKEGAVDAGTRMWGASGRWYLGCWGKAGWEEASPPTSLSHWKSDAFKPSPQHPVTSVPSHPTLFISM